MLPAANLCLRSVILWFSVVERVETSILSPFETSISYPIFTI
jgi:hypothetical protein